MQGRTVPGPRDLAWPDDDNGDIAKVVPGCGIRWGWSETEMISNVRVRSQQRASWAMSSARLVKHSMPKGGDNR